MIFAYRLLHLIGKLHFPKRSPQYYANFDISYTVWVYEHVDEIYINETMNTFNNTQSMNTIEIVHCFLKRTCFQSNVAKESMTILVDIKIVYSYYASTHDQQLK